VTFFQKVINGRASRKCVFDRCSWTCIFRSRLGIRNFGRYDAIDEGIGRVIRCAGVLAGHPFVSNINIGYHQVIENNSRVRLQTQRGHSSFVSCLSSIIRNEGVRGLYKGMASPLAGVAAINR
jgi:hypothetical protein